MVRSRRRDAYDKIVRHWGSAVLGPDGLLDRAKLRQLVFHDHAQLEQMNEIVHPYVERQRSALVAEAKKRGDRIVVCDIPLLFERHLVDLFDRVVLVDAPRDVRLERLVSERQLPEADAMAMIAAQMPAALKRARADHVIDNDGTLGELEAKVRAVWTALQDEERTRKAAAIS